MALSQQIGARVRRREDPRLVAGAGRYLDDYHPVGLLHAVFVRSYLPNARVTHLDAEEARRTEGLIAIYTADDLVDAPGFPLGGPKGTLIPSRPLLNGDRVRFAGDLVAMVVAETREQARDAADRVLVELDAQSAVSDVDAAREAGAPLVHEEFRTNVAYRSTRTWGDVAAAFDGPHRVVRARIRNQRLAGIPIEPRGVLAEASRWEPSLTVWSSTQIPHGVRDEVAEFLSLPQTDVRVIAPEVGGGFGAKLSLYPEELLVAWAARRLSRPVKWVEERTEHMQATTHGRGQVHDAELAVDADGRIRGLRIRLVADLGAYPMASAWDR